MRHEPTHPITKAILHLLQATCFEPESLEVIETLSGGMLDVVFEPHMRDLKILIGKKGKTILAIRHLAGRMGKQCGVSVAIEVRDSFRGDTMDLGKPFEFQPSFTGPQILPVLNPILDEIYGRSRPSVAFEDHEEKLYVIIDAPRQDLTLIKAIGGAFYPYGYRNGRKLSFRILDYHPNEQENRGLVENDKLR